MYNNPTVYTTGLPTILSFFFLLAGVIDWGMAITFFRHQYFDMSWEQLRMEELGEQSSPGMTMDDDGDMESMASMEAQATVLWQMMGVIIFQLFLGIVMRKMEKKDKSQLPNDWKDELFNSPLPADCNPDF